MGKGGKEEWAWWLDGVHSQLRRTLVPKSCSTSAALSWLERRIDGLAAAKLNWLNWRTSLGPSRPPTLLLDHWSPTLSARADSNFRAGRWPQAQSTCTWHSLQADLSLRFFRAQCCGSPQTELRSRYCR